MTVSGFTITWAERQPRQTPHSSVQRTRPATASFGRFFAERWSTPIRWRWMRNSYLL